MNTTLKNGKYNDNSNRVQYESHYVKGKSYTGFYMFVAGLVTSIVWLINFFSNL